MPHYLMGGTKVRDPAGMQSYISKVKPTVQKYGGEFVFEAACEESLEGSLDITSGVVIKFESAEAAKRWYNSPEYSELRKLRKSTNDSTLLLMRPFGQ